MARKAPEDPKLEQFHAQEEWLRMETERWGSMKCSTERECKRRFEALKELELRANQLKREFAAYHRRLKGSTGGATLLIVLAAVTGSLVWAMVAIGFFGR
jgi:hypothetical protein